MFHRQIKRSILLPSKMNETRKIEFSLSTRLMENTQQIFTQDITSFFGIPAVNFESKTGKQIENKLFYIEISS